MNPYMVNKCETLRFQLQKSAEVATSTANVLTAAPIFSPGPKIFVRDDSVLNNQLRSQIKAETCTH